MSTHDSALEPGDLLFTPVPLARRRAGTWTAEAQRAFIAELSRVGVVASAARSVGLTARSAHQLRARAGAHSSFARAWDAAREQAGFMAIDRAKELGRGLVREPMYHRDRQTGWRTRLDNRVLFAALRALDREADAREVGAARRSPSRAAPPSELERRLARAEAMLRALGLDPDALGPDCATNASSDDMKLPNRREEREAKPRSTLPRRASA